MKILIWHCQEIFIGNIKKINEDLLNIDNKIEEISEKNVIVPWVTIESESDYNYFEDLLIDLKKLCKRFKTNKIVLIPFAHFSNKIPLNKISFRIISDLENYLIQNNLKVSRAHFGSAKDIRFFSPADSKQVLFKQYPKPEFILRK